jgi:hypothetical protein
MINPPKLESIMLPTKEDLFNNGYTSCGLQWIGDCLSKNMSALAVFLVIVL